MTFREEVENRKSYKISEGQFFILSFMHFYLYSTESHDIWRKKTTVSWANLAHA